VGQEYFINSQELQTKVANLLPSQGGAGAGFDLSASTQIVPIIDLTESAEGSNVRQDLQTAFSFKDLTFNEITNATTTFISNTGYFRVFGNIGFTSTTSSTGKILLNDGSSSKELQVINSSAVATYLFDYVLFLEAGDSVIGDSNTTSCIISVATRQIADISGNLVNP